MITYSLRKLEKKDLELVLSWRNRDTIRHYMFNDKKISWQEHIAWFEKLQSSKDRDYQLFCIADRPIGIVSLSGIDEHDKKQCIWGFYVGDAAVPKGSGLLLGYYGIEYAFNNYKIDKILSEVINFNVSSLNFHKKLFFKEIGSLPKKILRDGEFFDISIFDLEKKIWQANKDEIYKIIQERLKR